MSESKVGFVADTQKVQEFVDSAWDSSIIPTLSEYIAIPNQSPLFDKECHTNGLQEKAVDLLVNWVKKQNVPGSQMRVEHDKGRTPLIFITIDGADDTKETVLMYGHMDKQPPMTEAWEKDLGPWKPVIRDGKLYGRGGADDGYSIFAAITSIMALKSQGVPHARICIVIEGCEESGSPDLPYYIDKLSGEIGTPSLIVCLDSGSGNYKQFWLTTSLRGLVVGTLEVSVLSEAVHSGMGSGMAPDSFRVMRSVLSRIENESTGKMIDELYCQIPEKHLKYAKETAATLGDQIYAHLPLLAGGKPVTDDLTELALNGTWRPTLTVTGAAGLPTLVSAGNVVRTSTSVKLSIRLPPIVDAKKAAAVIKERLEANPPYGAHVKFDVEKNGTGFSMPELEPWLEEAISHSSKTFYKGNDARYKGEGGSIPFMGMLGIKYPAAQFVITGVLGPNSNAHGPNEFLEISMGKNVTSCSAYILAAHYQQKCAGTKRTKTA